MKRSRNNKYGLIVSNESRLQKIVHWRFTPLQAVGIAALTLAAGFVISWLLLAYTPLRTLMPGYMQEASRAQTIEYILRLDSLQQSYNRNQAYLKNISVIFDTDREPEDSAKLVTNSNPLTTDSLLATSDQERKFVKMMEEREKYNISVLGPLAAENMVFQPVSDEAVISEGSRGASVAKVVLASSRPVCSIADGRVIDTEYSPRNGGYSVIVQHKRGFVSRISHLGEPLVEEGDNVSAGQIVALPQNANGRDNSYVTLEIWHNGTVLIPAMVL